MDPFEYRKPSEEQQVRIDEVRAAYRVLHEVLLRNPKSREMSLALTNLEQSAMWATKSIVFEGAGSGSDSQG